MIRVDRAGPEVGVPESLNGPDSAGARELARALEYREKHGSFDGFTFSIYKSNDVKEALLALFHRKCAYCETHLTRQPIDVEHFRPKGGYLDGPKPELKKPGYFWLAATWTNLFPSCIDCNRGRKQIVEGGNERQAGKENHFPLVDPARRATAAGEEANESPLLLDPCVDAPERHLEFPNDGEGVIRAALRPDGTEDPRGLETIAILGLDAIELIADRKIFWKMLQSRISHIQDALDAFHEASTDAGRTKWRTKIAALRGELEACKAPSEPYSAMARQIIDRFVSQVDWP